MATVYDKEISKSEVERFANISEDAAARIGKSFFPGAIAVNALPFLRHLPTWFPGAGFHKFATECRVCTDQMLNVPFRRVKERVVRTGLYLSDIFVDALTKDAGNEVSSLTARLLQCISDGQALAHEEDIKAVAATSFVGGADTTLSFGKAFIYAMVVNVEAQKKAQDEIDSIVGNKRLPDLSDRQNMPYLEAIYREVMRWRPVLPLGLSHVVSEDDIYNGYFIPKGLCIQKYIPHFVLTRQ
ncbi:hypothetical protein DXG01_016140 [Tephrocybe rancida]|nr:hypothetical protein DXG01_016140 [Tephrocybe rancida]